VTLGGNGMEGEMYEMNVPIGQVARWKRELGDES
jgi:hypothetical protein